MNYSKIIKCDTNNGNGFRVTLFVSGCTLNCPHCQNKSAQNFNYGNKFSKKTHSEIIDLMSKPYIKGFSLLGGEPFDNICEDLVYLLEDIKSKYPRKSIYIWSGYTYNELLNKPQSLRLLKYADMLRDGRYIEELKDLNQYLQGSKNQKCVDVQKSIKLNKIIEYKF